MGSLIAPTLEPAGFGNWESSGALVTGLVAKELVVSSFSQIYAIPEEFSTDQGESTTVLEDISDLSLGLVAATANAGKSILEVLTPGINLFPQEAAPENLALSRALQRSFTPLSAAAYLIFVLLYIPCVAAIGAQKHEFGWKWAGLSVFITMVVPWVAAVTIYQVGSLIGLG